MPHGIVVSSQKGGVGKTTIAVNLATSLNMKGFRVLLIDGDYVNPSIGFHLGLEQVNVGLRAVLNGKEELNSAIVMHSQTGLRVLPTEVTGGELHPNPARIHSLFKQLQETNYDYIVLDLPPGMMAGEVLAALRTWNPLEVLIIVTPEMASCTSAVRLASIYDKVHIQRRFVLNRVRNRKYELSIDELEDVCGDRMLAVLPEDEVVPVSVATRTPAYVLDPKSNFSAAINVLARHYSGDVETDIREGRVRGSGFWSFILSLFRRR